VLHTWGQKLDHHPHVHCIVPGGGIAPNGESWVRCRWNFLLSVKVLSRLFRRLFLEGLEALHAAGELQFFADLDRLKDTKPFRNYLSPLRRREWVVYAKRPFAGPAQVLAYLARYTHRVAIANSRLLSLCDGTVNFRWRDYKDDNKSKVMTLEAGEFIRRFLLHVLPDGFHRIRHYGLFANGHRAGKLALCRKLLKVAPAPIDCNSEDHDDGSASDVDPPPCPCCGGRMRIIESFNGPLSRSYHVRKLDSS
jgi:Putative transposase